MADRIFDYGSAGRGFVVDDQGRLVVNASTSGNAYVYAYGDTGYPLCVDGAGRILVNVSGLETSSTSGTTVVTTAISGLIGQNNHMGRREIFAGNNGKAQGAKINNQVMQPEITSYDMIDDHHIGIIFDGESLWVMPYDSDYIIKVNPADGSMVNLPHGSVHNAMSRGGVWDGRYVWTVPCRADYIRRIDPNDNSITKYSHGQGIFAFEGGCFDGKLIWYAPLRTNNLCSIDPFASSGVDLQAYPLETPALYSLTCPTFDGENIWCMPLETDYILKFDPENPSSGNHIKYDIGPNTHCYETVFDGQNIWTYSNNTAKLMKISTLDDSITYYPSTSGDTRYGMSFDGKHIWLMPNGNDLERSNIIKVDPNHPESGNWARFPVGSGNAYVSAAFDGENIWTLSNNGNKLYKIRPQEFGRPSIYTDGTLNIGGDATFGGSIKESAECISTSGLNLIQGSGGSVVQFNGKFYAGQRSWGAIGGHSVYRYTPSENGTELVSDKVFTLPSGGYPWALAVVGDQLYAGGSEGGPGCVYVTNDGENWSHFANLPYTTGSIQQPDVILGMTEYDGELVVTIANNLWMGPHPIYRYDTAASGFEVLTYEYSYSSNWGWTWDVGVADGKLYTISNFGKILNCYDGATVQYTWCTGRDIGDAIEYNGNTYLIGDKIYRVVNNSDNGIDYVEDYALPGGVSINGHSNHPAIVYNNKLWVSSRGILLSKDGDTWAIEDASQSGNFGYTAAIHEHNGDLFAMGWGKYLRHSIPLLTPGKCTYKHGNNKNEYVRKIADFIGVDKGLYTSKDEYKYVTNDFSNSPNFPESGVLASGDSLKTAISSLNTGLFDLSIPSGTPSSGTAPGEAGWVKYDENYVYVCINDNVWKRSSLSSW